MAFPWATVGTMLYYILLPVIWILKIVWTVITLISAPIIHFVHFLLHGLALPIHFLARFEVQTLLYEAP